MGREEGTFPMSGGVSMARRMTNAVGANFVQGSVQSSKLQATSWAGSESYGLGTNSVGQGTRILRLTKLDRSSLVSGKMWGF